MESRAALTICVLVLPACSTTPVPFVVPSLVVPTDIVATVSKPHYTGWQLDHCKDEGVGSDATCVNLGGDIYKVTLLDVRTLGGKKSRQS